jgi:hypothetical protein
MPVHILESARTHAWKELKQKIKSQSISHNTLTARTMEIPTLTAKRVVARALNSMWAEDPEGERTE